MNPREKTKEELARDWRHENTPADAEIDHYADKAWLAGYAAAEARAEAVIGIHTLVEMVSDHMDWDLPKTLQWFQTQNPLAGESTPFAFYIRRPEKCVRWIQSLINEELP